MLLFGGWFFFFAVIGITHRQASASLSTDDVKYIEAALANVTAQVAVLGTDRAVSHSLTSVTSLLQLSLLKQLLTDSSSSSSPGVDELSKEESNAVLNRLEALLNTTVSNQEDIMTQSYNNQLAIVELQEQVSAMFSTLNSVKDKVNKVLKYTSPNGTSEYAASSLPHSCQEIKSSFPDSPSDYYTIVDSDGHTRHVYCHMGELCGSSEGWTRIAHLDMTDPEEKCPDPFKLYEANGVRACGKFSSGCLSTTFPSDGISYSEVCGKVIGYQFGSPDGPHSNQGINNVYLDGISLTHGNPRTHIWSFIGGVYESVSNNRCPCGTVGSQAAPSFVGKHYFCEAAAVPHYQAKLYTDDPLWDGKGCGSIERPCCSLSGLPWFHRSFSYTTNDYMEMRVCGNEETGNEDVPVASFQIYVK